MSVQIIRANLGTIDSSRFQITLYSKFDVNNSNFEVTRRFYSGTMVPINSKLTNFYRALSKVKIIFNIFLF